MSARLTAALDDGRLCLTSPTFYTGPLPFWQMPASLVLAYAASALVITHPTPKPQPNPLTL